MHVTVYMLMLVFMLILAGLTLFLLQRQKLLKNVQTWVISAVLLVGALLLRLHFFDAETTDFWWFLDPWVQHYRDNGGFLGLAIPIGNYNFAYHYFLALLSYIPLPTLHLIKLLSTLFDLILAYYVMLIVGLHAKSDTRKLIAFFLVLFLPTVFLNSAYWAQCDSIYVSFSVMGFYYAMRNRPAASMVCAAVAVAFKLQAVFLFPIYFIFLWHKKIRIRHLLVFPATYLALILPTTLLGRPFLETLLFYFDNALSASLGFLSLNAPSIFALLENPWSVNESLARIGIISAFGLVLLVYLIVLLRHRNTRLPQEDYLNIALIFALGVPLFLPHMHDRFFYMADIFAVILGLSRLRFAAAIPITQFASLLGYHAYLRHFADPPLILPFEPLPTSLGAIALIVLLVCLMVHLTLRRPREAEVTAI